MILAVMQPYLFPYIGYFQLIAACDTFVVYDDVQHIRRGWVNRNRILVDGAPHWLTLPVAYAPVETSIRDMRYRRAPEDLQRVSGLLAQAYRKAPHWETVRGLVDEVMAFPDDHVGAFNENALQRVCGRLGLEKTFLRSSALDRDRSLAGQDAILDICRRLGADAYVNAIGGTALYSPRPFADAGFELAFVRPQPPAYDQFGEPHVPNLSILDVLAFCAPEQARAMLAAYQLVAPEAAA